MASPTVIDQLIVKLGLDPTNFNKGQKQAAAEMIKTKNVVKKSSDDMSASILGFTKKLLGIASVAIVVKKSIGYVSDLSTEIRQLGIDSRNFGIAANEMKNFQNVGEMMGGKAEQVTQTIGNITKAVYDLAYNGQVSDSLLMLARLGVQFQDTAGNARNFKDIVLDTQKSIQQLMGNGSLTRENANQMLQQAGFDPGLSQAILSGNVQQLLAQQEARRQVSKDSVDTSTDWEKSATNRDQAIQAATLKFLPGAAQKGKAVNDKIAAGADALSEGQLNGVGDAIAEGGKMIADALKDAGHAIMDSTATWYDQLKQYQRDQFPRGPSAYESTFQKVGDKYGIDPRILKGIAGAESSFNPGAVNKKSGAAGLMGLMQSSFPGQFVGINPYQDIDTSGKYFKSLYDDLEKRGYPKEKLTDLAMQAYNAGEGRLLGSMKPGGTPLAKETLDYPSRVTQFAEGAVPTPNAQTQQNSNTNSTVNIGEVNVHTQADDADAIGRDINGSIRKFNAAQADVAAQ